MRTLLCFVTLAVLVVFSAGIPSRDEQLYSGGRVRRFINPWDFFNRKKDTKKKPMKSKPKPKPTTQATTTAAPVTVATTTAAPVTVATTPTSNYTVDKNKIPEHIAEQLGKIKTKAQVERFLGITQSMSQRITVNNTIDNAASGQTGNSNENGWATSTECIPRPKVIRYPQPALYRGLLWPYCGMALKCGGCCIADMHQHCVAKQVKNVTHYAYFVPYSSVSSQSSLNQASKRKLRNKRSFSTPVLRQIVVENHLSCKCQCKVRPEHCNPERQYHKDSTCQCECKDGFTESKLNCKEPFRYDKDTCSCKCAQHRHCSVAKQQWDNEQCKCVCDSGIRCPKGQALNKNSCECEVIKMSDILKFYNNVIQCKKSNTC